jgi:hypothetical protein
VHSYGIFEISAMWQSTEAIVHCYSLILYLYLYVLQSPIHITTMSDCVAIVQDLPFRQMVRND